MVDFWLPKVTSLINDKSVIASTIVYTIELSNTLLRKSGQVRELSCGACVYACAGHLMTIMDVGSFHNANATLSCLLPRIQ